MKTLRTEGRARHSEATFRMLACAKEGNWEGVFDALSSGVDVNAVDPESGLCVILYAAKACHAGALERVIRYMANLEARDPATGETPLLIVARELNFDCLDVLLKAGANREARNDAKQTALMLGAFKAAEEDDDEANFERKLEALSALARGPSIAWERDAQEETALFYAIRDTGIRSASVAVFLVDELRLDVFAVNARRETALMVAAGRGSLEVVDALCVSPIQLEDESGLNALDHAIQADRFEAISLLGGLQDLKKADPETGSLPVQRACRLGKWKAASLLLGDETTLLHKDKAGQCVCHEICASGDLPLIEAFFEQMHSTSDFYLTLRDAARDSPIDSLVKSGADPNLIVSIICGFALRESGFTQNGMVGSKAFALAFAAAKKREDKKLLSELEAFAAYPEKPGRTKFPKRRLPKEESVP